MSNLSPSLPSEGALSDAAFRDLGSHPGSHHGGSQRSLNKSKAAPKSYTPTSSQLESYLYLPGQANNMLETELQPRRSSARRLFSIICVFDLLFIGIIWLIVAINTYGDLTKAVDQSVSHFRFQTSMADIVLLSIVRSVCLILHYWVVVSVMQATVILTTTVSTLYVFLKLTMYNREVTNNTFETYGILLASFVLCWVEVWLFETKVLKVENQVTRYLRSIPGTCEETEPLIGKLVGGGPSEYAESVYNYSAFQTPSASMPVTPRGEAWEYEEMELDPRGQLLLSVAVQSLVELSETVEWPDGWTTESNMEGITVFSRAQRKAPNRLFLSESHYPCSLQDLFKILYDGLPGSATWNKGVIHCEVVEKITTNLDVVYSIGRDGAGGLIKSRDFLSLRYWSRNKDMYYICSRDINDPVRPTSDKYSRGFNGPCGFVFFPAADGQVKLTYVVNVDLKMPFVPQKIINSSLVEVVHDFHKSLKVKLSQYMLDKTKP